MESSKIPKGNSNEPTHSTLVKREAVGVVPETLWRDLVHSPGEIPLLAQSLLDEFWPETYHTDILTFMGLDLAAPTISKKRDPRFREDILGTPSGCHRVRNPASIR